MPLLRKLNDIGINRLKEFLFAFQRGENPKPPIEILSDNITSELVPGKIEIDNRQFGNRLAAAQYLDSRFSSSDGSTLENDPGVWAWLSLFYYDELCPPKKGGKRRPGDVNRWIPSSDYKTYYRHLLKGPYDIYSIYRKHPEQAMLLLCGPLDQPGDFVEQLASRQEFITNKSIIETAGILYYDPARKRPKTGASTDHKPGTLRRFIDVIYQFDLTYDLYSLQAKDIINLLPKPEFMKYLCAPLQNPNIF